MRRSWSVLFPLPGWWRHRALARQAAEADADALIEAHGDGAYYVARQRARDAASSKLIDGRPPSHWARVRKIVSRRQPLQGLDTATRYLSIK